MFLDFLFVLAVIGTAGPGYNEKGYQAIEDHGFKGAFERAWEEREPYDSGSLKKDKLGNFGND